ncbi:MAG: DUF350 domain-containing protein [Flavobacteriales bacterium]|nr:DUF350 domain-containing protein [Flavobacteriales bacterium]
MLLATVDPVHVLNALVYALLGCVIFLLVFWLVERITPENMWKEILEKRNVALAVMAAGFMLAIALIIASAIHG